MRRGQMRRGHLLAVGLFGAASWLTMPLASAATTDLQATMDAAEETPNPGPAGAKGTARLVLDDAANTLCYELTWEGIKDPTAAHVHTGAKGVAGPVAVDFKLKQNGPKACVPADPTVLASIRDNPGGHYVNVHTADYPKGAIRGQLAAG
jgi:hypothetical protein